MTLTLSQTHLRWRPLLVVALAVTAFMAPATASAALWTTSTTTTLAVTTSPAAAAPAAPVGLGCTTPGNKQVTLSWTTVPDVTYDLMVPGYPPPLRSEVMPPVVLTQADIGAGRLSIQVRARNSFGSTLSTEYFDIKLSSNSCVVTR
jgi:hypothetical protein